VPEQALPSQSSDVFHKGPDRPIGHSLDTPEARQRISQLIAQKIKEGVSDSPAAVDESLPPLVGGTYGFESPTDLVDGVPTAVIQMGSAAPRYVIIVEKLHHRLSIFQSDAGAPPRLVKTFRAITGKDPEDKAERGDLRTPEGVYFVRGRLPDDALPPKYGRLALTLDYPNVFDRLEKKSGHGIWLHATDDPKRLLKPFDTEGCIAVSNEDVLEIERYITPGVTPLLITKEMTMARPEALAAPRDEALRMLESWRVSWKTSDLDTYMEFYSDSFRQKRMNKRQWQAFKQQLANQRQDIDVKISDPTIVAIDGQLVISFLQEYRSNGHSDFGMKALFLRWESDRYRIVAEEWQAVQKTETALQELQRPEGQL
jgi:murein L,D-transpeptidase YafK